MRLTMALMLATTALMAVPKDEALFLNPNLDAKQQANQVVLQIGKEAHHLSLKDASFALARGGGKLPFPDQAFDQAISYDEGSQIPPTTHRLEGDTFSMAGLGEYCKELARILKSGGVANLVVPASHDVVFTTGKRADHAVFKNIQKVVDTIGSSNDPEVIQEELAKLTDVNRATFVCRNGQILLVTDAQQLYSGEKIWRKEGANVCQGYFHSDEDYLIALANSGLHCTEIKRPCFFGNIKYKMYHAQLAENEEGLGRSYINKHPFTIFIVNKVS